MNWIIQFGVKYSKHDCVLISWQADDMPNFGRIGDIIVIEEYAFFIVNVLTTFGIDRHYHSFCVKESVCQETVLVSDLACQSTFRTHEIGNIFYITSKFLLHKC